MEFRRRLGKRRMAHFSENFRTPIHDIPVLWGLRGTKRDNNWQWEAPYQPPERAATDQLPSWLMDLDQSVAKNTNHEHLENNDRLALQSKAPDDLERFRDCIGAKTTSTDFLDICDTFCETFKQSLSFGQVSATVLSDSIREVPHLIRNNTVSKDIEYALCIAFYQAVWDGIMACTVLRPAEIEPEALRILLIDLPRLPIHMSGGLIADILRAITDKQKHDLQVEIFAIGDSLFPSNTCALHPKQTSQSTYVANSECSPPKRKFLGTNRLEDILGALMETFALYSPKEQARKEVCRLVQLFTVYTNRVILPGVGGPVRGLLRRGDDLRMTCLKLIARGPLASEDLLVQACMIIRDEYHDNKTTIKLPRLRLHAICDILFEYWVSMTPSAAMKAAHDDFKASFLGQNRPHNSAIHLCLVLQQHRLSWRREIKSVLRMLRRIRARGDRGDMGDSVYYVLRRLENARIYLPASALEEEMKLLCENNVHQAAKLHLLYSKGRANDQAIPLERFPFLAIAMIHDPLCHPSQIFHLFSGYRMWRGKTKSNARLRLLEQMAFEFSQTNSISNRVALKYIAWCIRYIMQQNAPLSNKVLQALINLGVEEHMIEKGSIGYDKLRWVMDVVAQAEGIQIAKRMEAVIIAALHQKSKTGRGHSCTRITLD
ncbi:hypothetical protein V493_02021 [Pseudogymnoascus sp. VKM F-4281 (FW-2241)]|nr:hypothetical protein V493_02021 [Pseudogymnoascus sp. VKM F-4281 (FW-2241)]